MNDPSLQPQTNLVHEIANTTTESAMEGVDEITGTDNNEQRTDATTLATSPLFCQVATTDSRWQNNTGDRRQQGPYTMAATTSTTDIQSNGRPILFPLGQYKTQSKLTEADEEDITHMANELREYLMNTADTSLKKNEEGCSCNEKPKCLQLVHRVKDKGVQDFTARTSIHTAEKAVSTEQTTMRCYQSNNVYAGFIYSQKDNIKPSDDAKNRLPHCYSLPVQTFNQMNQHWDAWFRDLADSEALFINQATEVIQRDMQLFKQREELGTLHVAVEWNKAVAKDWENACEYIHCQELQIEYCLEQFENYYQHCTVPEDRRSVILNALYNEVREVQHLRDNLATLNLIANQSFIKSQQNLMNYKEFDKMVQLGAILNAHLNTLGHIERDLGIMKKEVAFIKTLMKHCEEAQNVHVEPPIEPQY